MSSPIFMGFRAKEPWKPVPEWRMKGSAPVEYVCSVSDCICEPPEDSFKRWDFNQAYCYGTEAEALATVPTGREKDFALFAYWLMPVALDADGCRHPVNPNDHFASNGDPLPADPGELRDYETIGYDVVSTNGPLHHGFECSPLSCNSMAESVAVNRYCLVDRLKAALDAARVWTHDQLPPDERPAPGNYIVVKVAMKRGTIATASTG